MPQWLSIVRYSYVLNIVSLHVSLIQQHARRIRLVDSARVGRRGLDSPGHEPEHAAKAGDAVRGDGRAHSSRRARLAQHDLFCLQ